MGEMFEQRASLHRPDYMLVHRDVPNALLEGLTSSFEDMYGQRCATC